MRLPISNRGEALQKPSPSAFRHVKAHEFSIENALKTPSAITVGAEVKFWTADGIGGVDVVQDSTPRDRRRRGWPADVRRRS